MVQQGNNSGIKAVNGNTKFHRLLAEFPSLVEAVSTPRKLRHEERSWQSPNFPKPETVKELRRFLAICNFYRRFIPHAARTQSSVKQLFKGSTKGMTGPLFYGLRNLLLHLRVQKDLAEATVLYHPSADASLAIVVDASDTAVGAALHQQNF
ncbi:retrovirus-related Pol polyprotein from transposon 297 [Trichonephila clavata]|uniref:Retrovirus-related Pol polyprotein from transposon 297 n=1 Tax=Trichonephila clavata TaxID=2740835 RepID=A0A8X6LXH7_TRICU|nr:retrovirus-related Pol polyprotein from transposon 297 [Trichonephila clavata]